MSYPEEDLRDLRRDAGLLKKENEELRTLLRSLLAQVEKTAIKHPQQAEHRDRARKILEL